MVEWEKVRVKKDCFIEVVKCSGWFKCLIIKLILGVGVGKKLMYLVISKIMKVEIEKINKQYFKEW